MTLAAVIVRAHVKELQALGRLRRTITGHAGDADWVYGVSAMDERIHRLRELLAQDDPQLVAQCAAGLDDERQADALVSCIADMPVGHRLH